MINISANFHDVTVHLGSWVTKVAGQGRVLLYSAAANAVAKRVRAHLSAEGQMRHESAGRLGAQPTGFLQDAARGTVHHADETAGEVVIPAPLGRAFHDVTIRPKDSRALTIPAAAEAYGRRAGVLAANGWQIFKPKGRKFLMGNLKGEEPKILYWLKDSVKQDQDRSLLPGDEEMEQEAAGAIIAALNGFRRAS